MRVVYYFLRINPPGQEFPAVTDYYDHVIIIANTKELMSRYYRG
jgi:hypothetical protein